MARFLKMITSEFLPTTFLLGNGFIGGYFCKCYFVNEDDATRYLKNNKLEGPEYSHINQRTRDSFIKSAKPFTDYYSKDTLEHQTLKRLVECMEYEGKQDDSNYTVVIV